MFNVILSVSILLSSDPLFDSVKEVVASEVTASAPRFRLEKRGGRSEPGQIFYMATAIDDDRTRLNVSAYRVPVEEVERSWQLLAPSVATDGISAAFSGFACGSQTRRSATGSGMMIHSVDGVFMVVTQLSYRGPTPSGEGHSTNKQFVEGLNRRLLSKCRGLQSQAASPMILNGSSVGSVSGPRGELLIDLVRYCQAYNLQLNTNQVLGTASFTAGGEQVIIPLAAKRIKDGARWIDTTDISVIKDDKWYVSYAALQNARGQ